MGHRWPSVPLPLQHCHLLPSVGAEVAEEGEPSTKRAKTRCRPTRRGNQAQNEQ